MYPTTVTSNAILTLHFNSATSGSTGFYVPSVQAAPKKRKLKKRKPKKKPLMYCRVVEP